MRTQNTRTTYTQKLILYYLKKYGNLGTGELVKYTEVKDDETILINCKKLVKQGWIYDKEGKHGKYRLVEYSKIPSFLTFRARNRLFKIRLLNYIFKKKEYDLQDFSNKIGSYLLYVIIEALRQNGPHTAEWLDSKDPRMNDKDLLRDTWLRDTIDPNLILDQVKKYYNDNYDYDTLVKMYESTFPEIYKNMDFHVKMVDYRQKRDRNNKKRKEVVSKDIFSFLFQVVKENQMY